VRSAASSPSSRALQDIGQRAEGSGRIAFREVDHRAGVTDFARADPLVVERREEGAGFAGHTEADLGGQHPAGHLARQRVRSLQLRSWVFGRAKLQQRLAVAAQAGTQHAAHNVHQQPDVRPGVCLTARDQLALGALILARHVTEPLRGERRQPGPYLCCQGVLVPGSNEPAWLLAGDVRRPTAD
jgi:hypothetical protein